jgi:hypothetical protein
LEFEDDVVEAIGRDEVDCDGLRCDMAISGGSGYGLQAGPVSRCK